MPCKMGKRGARQGASEAGSPALFAADNAAAGKRRFRAVFVTFSSKKRGAGVSSEAGGAPSSANLPGVGLPQGGLAPFPDGLGVNALVHIAEAVTAAKAAWLRGRSDFWVLVSKVGCRDR